MFGILKKLFAGPLAGPVDCFIAGLGNPGNKYRGTRHNIGFDVLDRTAQGFKCEWISMCDSWTTEIEAGNRKRVLLTKPVTYMNRSGLAVRKIKEKTRADQILIVVDDMELPLGRIRFRKGGSSGGHNGVQSVIEGIGDDFHRLRIGIGKPDREKRIDHVLGKFTEGEKRVKERVVEVSTQAVLYYINNGIENSMNRYNGINITG